MIIEFKITNFRSIKETQIFSMLSSDRVKVRQKPLMIPNEYSTLEVLPVSIIYGANNVGKSNLIKAFFALKWLVTRSHSFTVGNELGANESFELDIQTQKAPTIFELDFITTDEKRYLYIVEFDKVKIIREELHYYRVSKTNRITKRQLFVRLKNEAIKFGDDFRGIKKPIEERLIENMLFLSKAIQENNQDLRPILDFFQNELKITTMSNEHIDFQTRYFGKLAIEEKDGTQLNALNNALKNIDSGILRLEIKKNINIPENILVEEGIDDDDLKKQLREKLLDTLKHEIQAVHKLFDGETEIGIHNIALGEESEGTRKFIALFPKLMELGLSGGVFIVDELERSLHPLLTKTLIHIFANSQTNPKKAQLIFTSHDTTLFNYLDNDQINILEKNKYGATEIYAVSDIRGLRTDTPLEKWYLSGKLGGIPNITIDNITQNLSKIYGKAKTEIH
jgi:hypothetical protein